MLPKLQQTGIMLYSYVIVMLVAHINGECEVYFELNYPSESNGIKHENLDSM